MPRYVKRKIRGRFNHKCFKPCGVRANELDEVVLTASEMEAMRLIDIENLYQEAAAEKMEVSRATFGRILSNARVKITDALLNGKAINIE